MPAPTTTMRATATKTNYARRVHIARLSLTPLKGMAHHHPESLEIEPNGPRDDRRFCLVDPARDRVLRTVENPTLVGCRAAFDGTNLSVQLADGTGASAVVGDGRTRRVDYWGRTVAVDVVDGPWADLLSRQLGRSVALARVEPGQVVFGGSVTLLTTSSLREVAARLGQQLDPVALLADSERFRSTVVLDTGDAPAFVEDTWRSVGLGAVTVRVRGPVPRCAVVRIAPGRGVVEAADPLRALAADRTEVNDRGREVVFGVDADVVVPGLVAVGDTVQPS